jgi:EAL domain-containing protein (putative c-di-GMP-specific phosphodiesterase class I)
LSRWGRETACRQNKQWIDQGLTDVRVAVNVSARQFKESNVVEVVECVLAETGLPAKRLELEITEGVLLNNSVAEQRIKQLRESDISIALDDFGTGYSSLSYMSRLPVDVVKIDRSFVQDIHLESEKKAIVSAVATLSHSLDFSVVAEGVETRDELDVIREIGCDHIQGYLYCKPLPVGELTDWLKTNQAVEEAINSVN